MSAKDRLCVALDVNALNAPAMLHMLADAVGWIKINVKIFTALGPKIVTMALERGFKVFLDLKYHDIPNTVKGASRAAAQLGVSMFNIHCAGGIEMMKAAVAGVDEAMEAGEAKSRPLIIGVTVLTSLDMDKLRAIGIILPDGLRAAVVWMAKEAQKAGLDGVVCSPEETKAVRQACGPEFVIVTPGIRLPDAKKDDQTHVGTPQKAMEDGSSILVVGRPIIEVPDPALAASIFVGIIEYAMATQKAGRL
jgi:orotidine-5'-phosphate decarboxylase